MKMKMKIKSMSLLIGVLTLIWLLVRYPYLEEERQKEVGIYFGRMENTSLVYEVPYTPVGHTENTLIFEEPIAEAADVMEVTEEVQEDVFVQNSLDYQIPSNIIDVPALNQFPELYNGCEITSLAMLLNFMQIPVDKMDLIGLLPVDSTPIEKGENSEILVWGDPDAGFVGDITGNTMGYGVHVNPIAKILEALYEPGALNLSGQDFTEIEKIVAAGKPVIVWNTDSFYPANEKITWLSPVGKEISASLNEHCVVIVGFDEQYVYLNNPMDARKGQQVGKQAFIEAWEQMGSQALTYAE